MTEEKKDYVSVTPENEELKKIKKRSKTLAVLVALLAIIIIILAFYVYQLRSAVCAATSVAVKERQFYPQATVVTQPQQQAPSATTQQPIMRSITLPSTQRQRVTSPFMQMRQMQQRMNQMFSDPLFSSAPDRFFSSSLTSSPQIKFSEKPDKYVLSFLVPGMDKKNISIQVHNKLLTVTGKSDVKSKNQYSANEFTQSITMPDNANANKITSSYNNGVLTVNIPKTAASSAKATSIPIN